jgi:hypothetical protein
MLLMTGSRSSRYLRSSLDRLAAVLPPGARRVDLRGVGHLAADNRGRPELVAAELRRFLSA